MSNTPKYNVLRKNYGKDIMELAKIEIETDGGPWAFHNMPCSVCGREHAILELWSGHFQPCPSCQKKGFILVDIKKGPLFMRILKKYVANL